MRRLFGFLVLLVLVVLAIFMVDIRKTDDGNLPEVSIDKARLPKFDVDVGSIQVHQEQKTVKVPQVTTEERQINVPTIEVKKPSDGE